MSASPGLAASGPDFHRRFGDEVTLGDVVGDGEIISLRSLRPKPVVDPELHRLDGLLDVDPWDHFGNTGNRAGQR